MAVGRDHHPIAIWCDGRSFEADAPTSTRKRAAAGVLELFTSTLTALSPSWGSILFAWPLPSPSEVASRPNGFEFPDFCLSEKYVGKRKIQRIADLVDNSCITYLANGILVLTSGLFAPKPHNAEAVRVQAALAIASAYEQQNSSR